MTTLRDREVGRAAETISRATGLVHRPAKDGARVSGTYRQSITLASGRFAMPQNLGQVQERVKDITFQSKTRFSYDQVREIEALRSTIAGVVAKLPANLRSDAQVKKLEAVSHRDPLTLIHLVNRHDTKSSDFKDYEFSRATVNDLWQGGHEDVQKVLEDPESCRVTDLGNGVRILDL